MESLHLSNMPTPSSLFSAYASMSTSIMLFKTMFDQLIPRPLQHHIISTIRLFWKPKSPLLSLIIEEGKGMTTSHLYDAAETYLCSKTSPNSKRLKIRKGLKDKHISIKFAESEKIVEYFEGIELTWKFVCEDSQKHNQMNRGQHHLDPFNSQRTETEKRHFELSFNKKYKEKVINEYLMFVIKKSQEIKDEKKDVKLYNLEQCPHSGPIFWDSVNLEHPSTFDKLAMDPKMKKAIMEDLDRFVERKEFYRKVGKAWKRGYLLYGPPGTGKSSLIAAIANYLKFDIYDLQLMNVKNDSNLRKLMLKTSNRSILVIEDIDCSVELPDRNSVPKNRDSRPRDLQFSLSGLLNFIDGLWSSCGDERIIIFTTNNKEKLDPALLRPGRMDMHIHMSYLTGDGFKILASNYLDLHNHPRIFGEIEELIENMNVTPAEVAGELMKSNDVDVSLGGLSDFLKRKKIEEAEEAKDQVTKDEEEIHEAKRQKIDGT